jgi:hypothetical protein
MCFFVYLAIDFVYDIKMNDLFLSVMVRFAVVFEWNDNHERNLLVNYLPTWNDHKV